MNHRESPATFEDELARVLAYLQAHARNGRAMTRDDYDCTRPDNMMSSQRLQRRGYTMTRLAELAGLTPHPAGRRAKWAGIEADPEPEATPEPPTPKSWPLFGTPTRREVVIFTRDGQPPRVGDLVYRIERQAYSLR